MTLARAASLTSGPISRLVQAVADAQRPRLLGEKLDESVVHGIDDEEALGRGADLAGEVERGGDRAGRRDLERRVCRDDHRIAAAGLDDARLHAFGAGDRHRLARPPPIR